MRLLSTGYRVLNSIDRGAICINCSRKPLLYYMMANEISNDVTIITVDNMIYEAISEIRNVPMNIILNFVTRCLDGNKTDETIFW